MYSAPAARQKQVGLSLWLLGYARVGELTGLASHQGRCSGRSYIFAPIHAQLIQCSHQRYKICITIISIALVKTKQNKTKQEQQQKNKTNKKTTVAQGATTACPSRHGMAGSPRPDPKASNSSNTPPAATNRGPAPGNSKGIKMKRFLPDCQN